MKLLSWMAGCALLTGLGTGTLAAQPITVQVNGHLTGWQDNSGLLGPYLPPLLPVTATYTYDPSGPAIPISANQYSLSPSSASIVINAGPFTFQTGPGSTLQARINQGVPGGNWGEVTFQGFQNPPLPNGVNVSFVGITFLDPTSQWPTSGFLPTGAPNMTDFTDSQMQISGTGPGNAFFQIIMQIDSAQLLPPQIEVSPATGSFVPQQHFDAAVLLPLGGAPVATMQANINGNPLPLSYPGTCQLAAPTSSGRAALVCPGADAALASFQGITQIDWLVTLSDGSAFTQSVQWNLIR
jgi:hypothetical protein